MPSYDYRCMNCKSVITLERSMKDESTPVCSDCGSEDLNRIWNVVAIASGGRTPDVGQSAASSSSRRGGGCGSCSGHSCGSCHH